MGGIAPVIEVAEKYNRIQFEEYVSTVSVSRRVLRAQGMCVFSDGHLILVSGTLSGV